jgi:osmotically-inducible protein OsmY
VKQDVEAELRSDPAVRAADVAVAVNDGVVTLTGFVRSHRRKRVAEQAAKRVAGVIGVANDIDVRLPILHQRPDPQIARDAVEALRQDLPDAADAIKVIVKDGWVTLEGEVQWNYEREEAKWSVYRQRAVVGVSNLLRLKEGAAPADVLGAITAAIRRNALVDANRLAIEVDGGDVRLKGVVQSWAERDEAERVAWTIPGITNVDNQITVDRGS